MLTMKKKLLMRDTWLIDWLIDWERERERENQSFASYKMKKIWKYGFTNINEIVYEDIYAT